MRIQISEQLTPEAKEVRIAVFMTEQGFKEEFDQTDEVSTHLVMFEGDLPIAVGRYYFSEEKNSFVIGRLAVLKPHRGKGLGAKVLSSMETSIQEKGGTQVALMSQLHAKEFYQKHGYAEYGDIVYEESCPHVWMKKSLI